MRAVWVRLALWLGICMLLLACRNSRHDDPFIHQEIPVMIQNGKSTTIKIGPLSGSSPNDVGVRCSNEVWKMLTKGSNSVSVLLKSSDKKGTMIGGVDPSSSGTSFLGHVPNAHYLFYIRGERDATAVVEISFRNEIPQPFSVKIVVCKTPAETKEW
jgi:hypothetical protein